MPGVVSHPNACDGCGSVETSARQVDRVIVRLLLAVARLRTVRQMLSVGSVIALRRCLHAIILDLGLQLRTQELSWPPWLKYAPEGTHTQPKVSGHWQYACS